MAKPSIEVFDMSVELTDSLVITPPDDTYMIEVSGLAIGLSGADRLRLQIASEATGHSTYLLTADLDRVFDHTDESLIMIDTSTSIGFTLLVRGLKQAVPTVWQVNTLTLSTSTPNVASGLQDTASAFSTFRIFTEGGETMTSGNIYVTYHKRKNISIESHDFAASPLTSKKWTGLQTFDDLYFVSADLAFDVADLVRFRVSADGSVYDSGASDYRTASVSSFGQHGDSRTHMFANITASRTASAFCGIIAGFKARMPSTIIVGADAVVQGEAIEPRFVTGYRNALQKDKAVEIYGESGNTMDTGTVYLVKIK